MGNLCKSRAMCPTSEHRPDIHVLLGPEQVRESASRAALSEASAKWAVELDGSYVLELPTIAPGLWRHVIDAISHRQLSPLFAEEVVDLLAAAQTHGLDVLREAVLHRLRTILPSAVNAKFLPVSFDFEINLTLHFLSFIDIGTLCRLQKTSRHLCAQCGFEMEHWVEFTGMGMFQASMESSQIIHVICTLSSSAPAQRLVWPTVQEGRDSELMMSGVWLRFESRQAAGKVLANSCWGIAAYNSQMGAAGYVEASYKDKFAEDAPLGRPGSTVVILRQNLGWQYDGWGTVFVSRVGKRLPYTNGRWVLQRSGVWMPKHGIDNRVASGDDAWFLWPCGCEDLLDPIHNACGSCDTSCNGSCWKYHCRRYSRDYYTDCPIERSPTRESPCFPSEVPPYPSYVCLCRVDDYLTSRECAMMRTHDISA